MTLGTNTTIYQFCVYGTLRDDDDSGASWTQEFVGPASKCRTARVFGFKMFHKRLLNENWPWAVKTNNPNDFITVRVISFEPQNFQQQLLFADKIEDYDPQSPETSLYQRGIVKARITNNDSQSDTAVEEEEDAIMYFVDSLNPNCQYFEVLDGDWLKRDRTFIESSLTPSSQQP